MSISPTVYEQLFRSKVFQAAFLYLQLRYVFFWRKEIGTKAGRKMLVKLTAGRLKLEHSAEDFIIQKWIIFFSKTIFLRL